ncbi:hypothetical protein LY56_02919 [Roseinatronobacter thiooxidans]|uniref:Uncharacterized protein n=1 Tax=Roseinatronobacter thiooxidans TaxID=121821 RepID=A0A2W7PVA6_9RHOB|nr:hypothetical protein LY56_02919 [Roseinatronobacter thiooxidans]
MIYVYNVDADADVCGRADVISQQKGLTYVASPLHFANRSARYQSSGAPGEPNPARSMPS